MKRIDRGELLINSAGAKVSQLRAQDGFLNREKWFNFFAVSFAVRRERLGVAGGGGRGREQVGRDGITQEWKEAAGGKADRDSHQIWMAREDGWIKTGRNTEGMKYFPVSHRALTCLYERPLQESGKNFWIRVSTGGSGLGLHVYRRNIQTPSLPDPDIFAVTSAHYRKSCFTESPVVTARTNPTFYSTSPPRIAEHFFSFFFERNTRIHPVAIIYIDTISRRARRYEEAQSRAYHGVF